MRGGRRRGGLALLLLVCLAGPAAAGAADPFARGIDPVGFKLAAGSDAYLTVEGTRFEPARSWHLALGADYAAGLMALRLGDTPVDELIRRRLDLHLLGAWAVADGVELTFDLPFTASQSTGFDALAAETGFVDTAPATAGLGDLRVAGRMRLLVQGEAPVGLALVAEGRAPLGGAASFLGERGVVLAPRLVAERALGPARLAVSAGYRWRSSPGQYLNLYVGDELELGVAARWRLPEVGPFEAWSLVGELLAATPARAPFSTSDALTTPLEGLLGLEVAAPGGWHVTVGAGRGLGLAAGFGREGLRVSAMVAYRRTFVDGDRDGDGLLDTDDRCPDRAGPAVFDGCPDGDGDDIPDVEDRCPKQAGPALNAGCPQAPPYAVYEGGRIALRGSVNFDTGKASIRPESLPVLDTVAEILAAHPEIRRVRIDGHTDSQGGAALNRALSERRARAVVRYLVTHGVEAARLSARGFGEAVPVADNGTALGRARNRRVEMTILDPKPD